jgi:hypothetical protein
MAATLKHCDLGSPEIAENQESLMAWDSWNRKVWDRFKWDLCRLVDRIGKAT